MRKALLFLGILNDSDIDWMVAAATKQDVSVGETLIHEGKAVHSVYLVLDGQLAVTVKASEGREVARLRCGEVVGEMSFVDSRPPSATVRAVEKSRVLAIPRNRLNTKLTQDIAFSARFYRAIAVFLSDRLRETVGLLGYGSGQPLDEASSYADEMSSEALDNLSLAGARFDLLQRRLRAL
jgi:CRP/FNR family cyclic AMP-dependent transcriptional regulator